MSTATKVMHLIEDETITFPVRGVPREFRLRVWREKECPAVVMVSQVGDRGTDPACATFKVANYVFRALLGYLREGMDYFEVYRGVPYLVEFDAFGHGDRATLHSPTRTVVRKEEIEALLGTPIEL